MTTTATTRPNNVDLDTVSNLAQRIADDPAAADTTWAASVTWTGGFTSTARIRGFDPLLSDEPAGLGGTDRAPNPVEQLLAALGNCLAVGYAANAAGAGVGLKSLRIDVSGPLDLHTFLGLGGEHAGFSSITARVAIETDASADQIAELQRIVVGTSPVGHTLARAIPIDIVLDEYAS